MSLPILALLPQSIPLIFSKTKMTLMTRCKSIQRQMERIQETKKTEKKIISLFSVEEVNVGPWLLEIR
nr:hypothetical protein CFP56_05460 [Quercus suber]